MSTSVYLSLSKKSYVSYNVKDRIKKSFTHMFLLALTRAIHRKRPAHGGGGDVKFWSLNYPVKIY